MIAAEAHASLVEVMAWIDQNTAGLQLPTDERSMLALGCFDVALEHQAAIALLYTSSLHGSAFALLRVLTESLVRGLWLYHCATEKELQKFEMGIIDKTFDQLIKEFESKIGTPDGVLSGFKEISWAALNGFTHTGFHQVSRRHSPGKIEGSYRDAEIAEALGVAGALGIIAGGQIIGISDREDLMPSFMEQVSAYGQTTKS